VIGAVGRAGDAGAQGSVGATGAQGNTQEGFTGAIGRAGEAGPQGPVGATGAVGPVGELKRWVVYRDFQFANNRSDLSSSDKKTVSEIALYLKDNPSLRIAIDCSMESPRNQTLSDQRSSAIRSALIKAGVPSANIQIGEYGDKKSMRDNRTAVLVSSIN
jgi:outer membrane protein OmpA-like peptidoglycan-associated protein